MTSVSYLGETQIRHTTITKNPSGGVNARYDDVTVKDSIIVGNGAASALDLSGNSQFNIGYSLIRAPASATLNETTPGSNLLDTIPALGPLQDNGGPTQTHALLPSSPVIDRGDPSFVPPPNQDQRGTGFARIVNGRLDLGAYEVQVGRAAAVGVWRPSTRQFLLDTNGNGRWDGATGGDTLTDAFGLTTDQPVTGDWNRDGHTEVGVWRSSTRRFLLDFNGNDRWNGAAGGDILTSAFGATTDQPVTGDWNRDGRDEVGVWRPGTRQFYLDTYNDGRWMVSTSGDTLTSSFGATTDSPLAGKW